MHRVRRPSRRFALAMASALVLAVWLATTLGLVHRTVHPAGVAHRAGAPLAESLRSAADATEHRHGVLAALFGTHSDAECRLYDPLSHGAAALGVPLSILPAPLPAATFAYLEGQALSRWVALFEARGPPSIR